MNKDTMMTTDDVNKLATSLRNNAAALEQLAHQQHVSNLLGRMPKAQADAQMLEQVATKMKENEA